MQLRPGPGSNGYNYQPEFIDFDCVVTFDAAHTCPTGQIVCRDVSAVPSVAGADRVVLPLNANAGPAYGVYQGPPITHSGPGNRSFTITVRVKGIGVVSKAAAGISVGTTLIKTTLQPAQPAVADEPPISGVFIGTALATGAVTAPGAAIPGAICNAAISV